MFNAMISLHYIPEHLKRGIRIPLYKGGNKPKNVRGSRGAGLTGMGL